jgi:hypothetical protein
VRTNGKKITISNFFTIGWNRRALYSWVYETQVRSDFRLLGHFTTKKRDIKYFTVSSTFMARSTLAKGEDVFIFIFVKVLAVFCSSNFRLLNKNCKKNYSIWTEHWNTFLSKQKDKFKQYEYFKTAVDALSMGRFVAGTHCQGTRKVVRDEKASLSKLFHKKTTRTIFYKKIFQSCCYEEKSTYI